MLYHEQSNTVIVTPPKTGSTSLHAWLVPQGWAYVLGPQFDEGMIEKHTCIRPWQFSNRPGKCILIVRNPYDRMLSLYYHWRVFWNKDGALETFLREMIGGYQFYTRDLVSYWTEARATIFVKLEEINTLGNHVPVSGTPGHLNVSEDRVRYKDFTKEFTKTLFWRDFREFGYDG